MATAHIRFAEDDEEYNPSDSEEEYTAQEKELLKKVRKGKDAPSDSEEDVYAVHSDSSSSLALSDVEGQEEDDLPNVRAWGKDKRQFYSTDYVDPDYGGYQGKDATLADLEEEEARNLQKQLMQQLDDDDFALDITDKKVEVGDKEEEEEVIKTDVSKLSKRQKIELLRKEAPEFGGLVDDFKSKMSLAQEYLYPVIELSKTQKIQYSEALNFVRTYYEVIMNYCTNITMYLLLKATRSSIQNHPVIKRLYQFRQLLAQLDPVFESKVKDQIEILKERQTDEDSKPETKKVLKVLTKLRKEASLTKEEKKTNKQKDLVNMELPAKKSKKEVKEEIKTKNGKKSVKFNSVVEEKEITEDESEDNVEDRNNEENDMETNSNPTGVTRRKITYQIAKNKGLTPRRNKLQRNPRVKHRDKYRKAKIRRKGAIREVRTETTRYGGELSGIKTSVVKSRRIKS